MGSPDSVRRWRVATKERIVLAMGGECYTCGYSSCNEALALHHLNPAEKDFGLGRVRVNPKSWEKIVVELRKCILLCHNCHSEVHAGHREWPEARNYFNEDFAEYREILPQTFCKVCKEPKGYRATYCSVTCSWKDRPGRVDWSGLEDMKKTMNNVEIGKALGVSEAAVRRQLKKFK